VKADAVSPPTLATELVVLLVIRLQLVLGDRHQMPAVVEFRDELPYTPLGKLDKQALRG
jgi:hypothetical protein